MFRSYILNKYMIGRLSLNFAKKKKKKNKEDKAAVAKQNKPME
jgi:hypothetical protein